MDKSQPPPYFTPAQVYQPEQPPAHLYPPMPQEPHMQQPPQMPAQHSTLIIQTATPITVSLGDTPARTTCPSCRADIVTSVKHSATCKTHCCALFLCCFFCWPCVCVPYCMDSCQNADHYCPNCNSFIGTHEN